MALTPGARIGPFEVSALIGVGGMGEVYRARDTKLKRDIAIKVLPDALARDPDRLARFRREAEVLATLNHPNIAQIHGLEESGGTPALVMELVDGPTLAEALAGAGLSAPGPGQRSRSSDGQEPRAVTVCRSMRRCRSHSRSRRHSKARMRKASSTVT